MCYHYYFLEKVVEHFSMQGWLGLGFSGFIQVHWMKSTLFSEDILLQQLRKMLIYSMHNPRIRYPFYSFLSRNLYHLVVLGKSIKIHTYHLCSFLKLSLFQLLLLFWQLGKSLRVSFNNSQFRASTEDNKPLGWVSCDSKKWGLNSTRSLTNLEM